MKKIQKNLRGSFNVFSNSARQLEVPLRSRQYTVIFSRIFFLKNLRNRMCLLSHKSLEMAQVTFAVGQRENYKPTGMDLSGKE